MNDLIQLDWWVINRILKNNKRQYIPLKQERYTITAYHRSGCDEFVISEPVLIFNTQDTIIVKRQNSVYINLDKELWYLQLEMKNICEDLVLLN